MTIILKQQNSPVKSANEERTWCYDDISVLFSEINWHIKGKGLPFCDKKRSNVKSNIKWNDC